MYKYNRFIMTSQESLPKIYPKLPYRLNFDGCSKGNPGAAGIGAVLYFEDKEIWCSNQYIGIKTNNESEYMALILGLNQALMRSIHELIVCGDSLLVINQMKGIYKVKNKNLLELYNYTKMLCDNFKYIEFNHVYRNCNKRADRLANLALETKYETDTDESDSEENDDPQNSNSNGESLFFIKFPSIFEKKTHSSKKYLLKK